MKNILLIILLFTGIVNGQIVNIPDANFKAKLLSATSTNGVAYDIALNSVVIDSNNDGEIQVNEAQNITGLEIPNSNIASLVGIESFTSLQFLSFYDNQLINADLSALINLDYLDCSGNFLTSLDFSGLLKLRYLRCIDNLLTSLDFSQNPLFDEVMCINNNLTYINLKNGRNHQFADGGLENNTNLRYICIDEAERSAVEFLVVASGLSNVTFSDYCSFTPGGDYNTISGNILYDLTGNGCDNNDASNPYIKVNINDGTNSGATFTNNSGNYTFYTQAGDFTVTPQVENPSYFNFVPQSAVISFPIVDNSTQTQNFCITANGVHPDLEVVLTPIRAARPGFDSEYKLVFKNKGNQTQSGTINLTFDDARTDFVLAIPTINSQTGNNLLWNFTNLQPFETRVIDLILNVNSPMEIPAVNAGDPLNFSVQINSSSSDETPGDNEFDYIQTAVNSYDPNNKSCLEGNIIAPEDIGKYVHYNVNFENIGTADAVNVVIKDIIDTTMFDTNSLQLLYASNPVETKIAGNKIEFIFKNINLPPSIIDPIGGHGNVLFKIKTLPTLLVGDQIANIANIYFDYNAPIETNEARSTFATLNNSNFVQDQSISIAPNPAKNNVTVTSKNNIQSIQLFDVQGRILQTVLENNKTTTIDISNKTNGIYFLKVTTEIGSSIQKLIKE